MARAGMLTYSLWQMWQALAVSGESCLWVCLCRDRLELVANCLPHSEHSCFCLVPPESLDLPSLWCRESTVKDLMLCCRQFMVKGWLEGLEDLVEEGELKEVGELKDFE